MKYLKSIKDVMNESIENESIEGYSSYIESNDDFKVKYRFVDADGNKYLVKFKNDPTGPNNSILGTSYELSYFVWDNDINDWSISKIVNSGNVYTTLKTIFGKILNDFLKSRSWVKSIWFIGLAKKDDISKSQRSRIYLRHLQNNPISGFDVKSLGDNRIVLTKNNK